MNSKLYTLNPTQGKVLSIAGGSYRIIVSGDETNGEFAVIEMTVPPKAGPVPHSHTEIDESFFVLEGKVNFFTEEGNFKAEKGAFVNIPKGGLIHNFKNESNEPAILLCTVMPSGAEKMFEEVSEYFEKNSNISPEERKVYFETISKKYNTTLYPPDYLEKTSH